MEELKPIDLASEIGRIREIPPFDRLDRAVLEEVLSGATLSFLGHGSLLCHPDVSEPAQRLWLVRQGAVCAAAIDNSPAELLPDETLGIGSLLPLVCALSPARPRRAYSAAEDSFLWLLEGKSLQRLLMEPAVLQWLAQQWQRENETLRAAAAGLANSRQMSDQALALPAKSAGSVDITYVMPAATLGEAAALMAGKSIGSVIVGSKDAVDGIVTHTDLVARGMAEQLGYATPITQVMTPAPVMIDDSATVLEAGIEMAKRGFRHLLIRDSEGILTGVVSERDLFRIQQQGITHIFRPIGNAASIDELVEVAGRVREVTQRVFQQGMEISQFTRLVSSINDRVTQRLLSLIVAPPLLEASFCWLAFGSEGREEQGFVTDQDNGIVFAPPAGRDTEGVRAEYLEMAGRMNEALHACGFERCRGNIMAGNPELCLTLDEWKRKFLNWIEVTTPTATLNSTIFFDFRPIYGDTVLAEALRDHLMELVSGKTIFLHLLAKSALDVSPPVGIFSRFSTDSGTHKGTVDLKAQGTRMFVDIARIYALATGVRATNTEQRLRLSGNRNKRPPSAIEGDIAAYRLIHKLRLLRQLESLKDGRDANRIDPYLINELEQRTLRDSFRQAQSLQDRLKLDYMR